MRPKRLKQQFKLHVPRVTAEELAANETLMSGHWAYILTGEVPKWPAMKKWTLDYLKKAIPQEWVDFYPYNMYKMGNKPYVQRYSEAVEKFKQPKQGSNSRYMQMRLSLAGWERLVEDLAELPPVFWTEAEWINSCFNKSADANGLPVRDNAAIDNFFRVNQWNFLLVGEEGTGIFFHKVPPALSMHCRWLSVNNSGPTLANRTIWPQQAGRPTSSAASDGCCARTTRQPISWAMTKVFSPWGLRFHFAPPSDCCPDIQIVLWSSTATVRCCHFR